MTMQKMFIVGEKKYDKTTREFKVTYEDGASATVGTSSTTVYSIPSGKTFYLRTLVVQSDVANTIEILDGTTTKLKVTLTGAGSKEITNIKGLLFTDAVNAVATSGNAVVAVGGEVTEL